MTREKHVLTETNYCATMYEHDPEEGGRLRCTAAGRYMDTHGRVICARCAAGRVVVKLSDIPTLIRAVDQLTSGVPTVDLIDGLRALLVRTPEVSQ